MVVSYISLKGYPTYFRTFGYDLSFLLQLFGHNAWRRHVPQLPDDPAYHSSLDPDFRRVLRRELSRQSAKLVDGECMVYCKYDGAVDFRILGKGFVRVGGDFWLEPAEVAQGWCIVVSG